MRGWEVEASLARGRTESRTEQEEEESEGGREEKMRGGEEEARPRLGAS